MIFSSLTPGPSPSSRERGDRQVGVRECSPQAIRCPEPFIRCLFRGYPPARSCRAMIFSSRMGFAPSKIGSTRASTT